MACDIADGSNFDFDDAWQKNSQCGLEAVARFNGNFGANEAGTVDPQMTFSTPSTPTRDHFHSSFDGCSGPGASPYEPYPPNFGDQAPDGLYLGSIEPCQQPVTYLPWSLRQEAFGRHRRSVSEPPGGLPMHQQPPAVMFHRENHYLGKPITQKSTQLKSLPKSKSRQHPYARKAPRPPPSFRPEMRRAHTQPSRAAPTSTPGYVPIQHMPSPMMQGPQYVSSRVCTPAPEVAVMSPGNIDPALSQPCTPCPTTPTHQMNSDLKKSVSIPLTVDELRAMIFEAVQMAVGGGEVVKTFEEIAAQAEEKEADEVQKAEGVTENGLAAL